MWQEKKDKKSIVIYNKSAILRVKLITLYGLNFFNSTVDTFVLS